MGDFASGASGGKRATSYTRTCPRISIGSLDLLRRIERELREANADPANVVFEITETALMGDIEAGEAFTRGITEIGCAVALDDFGTGYGSFTYLQKLHIAYLKIDIEFVRDLVTNTTNQHLVKAIVNIAHGLGQQTIAEGVEDSGNAGSVARIWRRSTRRASISAVRSRSSPPARARDLRAEKRLNGLVESPSRLDRDVVTRSPPKAAQRTPPKASERRSGTAAWVAEALEAALRARAPGVHASTPMVRQLAVKVGRELGLDRSGPDAPGRSCARARRRDARAS